MFHDPTVDTIFLREWHNSALVDISADLPVTACKTVCSARGDQMKKRKAVTDLRCYLPRRHLSAF